LLPTLLDCSYIVSGKLRYCIWDVVAGRTPAPPAAQLLGWKLLEVDPERTTIKVEFQARPEFVNPVGLIQGGFLAAMLDDTLGPALVATLGLEENALVESLFATLKDRLLAQQSFCAHGEARAAVLEWLAGFYPQQRRHSALGYLSPEPFEHEWETPTSGVA
jgi:Integrase core domain